MTKTLQLTLSAALVGSALATLAAPAMAQSSVTLYGNLDAGTLYISKTSGGVGYLPSPLNAGSSKQLKDGGIGASNWGFKGQEDLGSGLRALFQLQGNLALDTGVTGGPNSSSGSSFFNQMSVIGLAGGFGELKVGRQVNPMYFAMSATDARGGRYFGSVLTALVGINSASGSFVGDNSNPSFGTVYNDNALVYTSPTIGHVTVNAEYALGETTSGLKGNSQEALTAVYDDKSLKVSALFYNGYGNNVPDATLLYTARLGSAAAATTALNNAGLTVRTNTNRLSSIGALYAWSSFKVAASYFAARNPSKVIPVAGGSASLDMWTVGGSWNVLPLLNLTGGYYHIKDNTNAGNKASQFALGLDYYFSKRTIAYLEAATVSNHGANMNVSPVYATAVPANQSVHAAMLGLRHSF